ncbi:MAG TPA: rhomboid family intramembrane serine protease [Anaerolineales bacterium]|nr:rhomboid family intramembrane serine protease [Anaerolineales bacterium]
MQDFPQQPVPEPRRVAVRVAPAATVPYVTYTIVGFTVLVYLLQLGSVALLGYANDAARMDLLMALGARVNSLIREGQLWRFITPIFLHASIPHILFNMYALVAFGAGLEKHFGHARFLALYLLAGFAGNVLSFVLTDGFSVGASTTVFGLVGAEGVFLFQNRGLLGNQFGRAIGNVLFIVAVNLALGLTPGIDNWGHVGGLLGGLVFTWFAGPVLEVRQTGLMGADLELADRREAREVIVGAAAVLLIFGALAAWGMFAAN